MKRKRRRCQRRGETNTKETERQIQMKQTERKPDETRADKQKEQAGALATFGLRNTTKSQPITAFVLDAALSYFPKN